jgi:hypothetical protein
MVSEVRNQATALEARATAAEAEAMRERDMCSALRAKCDALELRQAAAGTVLSGISLSSSRLPSLRRDEMETQESQSPAASSSSSADRVDSLQQHDKSTATSLLACVDSIAQTEAAALRFDASVQTDDVAVQAAIAECKLMRDALLFEFEQRRLAAAASEAATRAAATEAAAALQEAVRAAIETSVNSNLVVLESSMRSSMQQIVQPAAAAQHSADQESHANAMQVIGAQSTRAADAASEASASSARAHAALGSSMETHGKVLERVESGMQSLTRQVVALQQQTSSGLEHVQQKLQLPPPPPLQADLAQQHVAELLTQIQQFEQRFLHEAKNASADDKRTTQSALDELRAALATLVRVVLQVIRIANIRACKLICALHLLNASLAPCSARRLERLGPASVERLFRRAARSARHSACIDLARARFDRQSSWLCRARLADNRALR